MTKKRREKTLKKELLDQLENDVSDLKEDTIQESISINDIVEYYHKQLYFNKEALEYLKSIKIDNPEMISRFKLGYSDGSLLDKLSENQKKELKKINILNNENVETFKNCLVVPVAENIYGININDGSVLNHGDFSKCLFNEKALKVYDEVLLCNNFLDTLALINSGMENVVSLKDHDSFNADQLKLFQDNRIKQVTIAYDNSNSLAPDLLITIFETEGFIVKKISPPKPHLRWIEAVNDTLNKTDIIQLIDNSDIFIKEDKEPFRAEKENGFYIFYINDVTYKLTGVKDIFVSNLRVHIKAEYEDTFHHDSLDLYTARSRTTFSNYLGNKFGIEPKRVERDLDRILDYLENERDKALNPDEKKEDMTDYEKQIGLDFLKSKNLFQNIIDDMTTLGYVGEDLNKILMYLCASSRKLDNPISVMITSQSASGKSMLVETVAKLIPSDDVVLFNSLSDQALQYIGDLIHKFLIMGEAVHNETIEHQLREILSSKQLSRLVTVKDEKTGKMKTELIKIKAVVSSVMSTTNNNINPENASRYFMINTDESVTQTHKIYEAQRNKYSLKRHYEKEKLIPEVIKRHHAAQNLLKKIVIVNTFSHYLKFPDKIMRLRRDHERFIDLIAVTCFLRQYQKKIKTDGNVKYIECDMMDYETAYQVLVNGVLASTITELPQQAVLLYDEVRQMVKEKADLENLTPLDVSVSQREIREQTGLNQMYVKRYIKVLVEYEYLKKRGTGARGSRSYYSLISDSDLNQIDISMIPTPKQMKKIINNI